jgi:hypothetical protein
MTKKNEPEDNADTYTGEDIPRGTYAEFSESGGESMDFNAMRPDKPKKVEKEK